MILFLVSCLIYGGGLVALKPSPNSLKAKPISYREHFGLVWAAMFSGLLLMLVFLVTSDFGFITVNDNLYRLLSLNNDFQHNKIWPIQAMTHLLIHADLLHLFSNVLGLGVASVYQRRVGARRFFAVLCVASVASIPSILFFSEPVSVCGISGGIFGLAAAYFTDEDGLSFKEWGSAILLFVFLMALFSLQSTFYRHSSVSLDLNIDHLGHAMGAMGAIIYCRLKPRAMGKQAESG